MGAAPVADESTPPLPEQRRRRRRRRRWQVVVDELQDEGAGGGTKRGTPSTKKEAGSNHPSIGAFERDPLHLHGKTAPRTLHQGSHNRPPKIRRKTARGSLRSLPPF